MATMTIDDDKKTYVLACTLDELGVANIKIACLDFCFRHDIRPTKGEYANETSVYARQHAAIEILKWAIAPDGISE